jgi:hypothetical protein
MLIMLSLAGMLVTYIAGLYIGRNWSEWTEE